MAIKTIFVTIVWIPGKLKFHNRKKKVFNTDEKTVQRVVHDLLVDTATSLKKTTMSPDPIESICRDLYYMVYETQDSKYPFLKSPNAPNMDI